jgi:hypothetical protein
MFCLEERPQIGKAYWYREGMKHIHLVYYVTVKVVNYVDTLLGCNEQNVKMTRGQTFVR